MDDGNWILYAAMIVIAFVSWVFNRIQESTAARRRDKEIEARRQDRIRRGLPPDELEDEEEDFLFDEEEYLAEQGEAPEAPPRTEEPLRQLFEALGGQVVEAPKPPQPKSPPPRAAQQPSGVRQKTVKQPQLSDEERRALERVKARQASTGRKRRKTGSIADMTVSELLHDRDGVRKAIVLREILDQPRSMRPFE